MEISKGIQIKGTSLWIEKEKILILNDLHLGYEEALLQKGILIPKVQKGDIFTAVTKTLEETKPTTVIINGDLKHEFGRILNQEWKDVLQFIDLLLAHCNHVVIIKGNHDPIISPILQKRNISVVTEYRIRDIIIVHGDQLIETDAKTIIIGHEHPAITLRENSKYEKYKCFLQGKWQGKELIAVPSSNPLLEGTDILKEQLLSPFLTNIESFKVYVISKGEVFNFGTIKNIKKISR